MRFDQVGTATERRPHQRPQGADTGHLHAGRAPFTTYNPVRRSICRSVCGSITRQDFFLIGIGSAGRGEFFFPYSSAEQGNRALDAQGAAIIKDANSVSPIVSTADEKGQLGWPASSRHSCLIVDPRLTWRDAAIQAKSEAVGVSCPVFPFYL